DHVGARGAEVPTGRGSVAIVPGGDAGAAREANPVRTGVGRTDARRQESHAKNRCLELHGILLWEERLRPGSKPGRVGARVFDPGETALEGFDRAPRRSLS